MQFFSIDFETFYCSKTFTLKKMSTDAYIYDPRFEALCLSIYNPKTQIILPQDSIAEWLKSIDPRKVGFIAQHAQFDGAILWRHYGFAPAFWVDTLSMSRAVDGLGVRHSLSAQCERYGLPPKTVNYGAFDGKRWAELSTYERKDLGEQCMDDSQRTYTIAHKMISRLPDEELRLIDLNLRMFTEPMLAGDVSRLTSLVTEERERKEKLLNDLQLAPRDLASDIKFENLLLSLGQEVVYKPAKSDKRGFKGAFAKSDEYMVQLVNSDDELISTLAQLRLDVKSTIQESRAERFLAMARRGPLPVYYHYYGARNSRFAGGEGCLTGDTVVTVLRRSVVIDTVISEVQNTDLVWDGEAFVPHGGLVCRGLQDIIEYDGIEGTEGHVVFTEDGELSLSEAKRMGSKLLIAESPGF